MKALRVGIEEMPIGLDDSDDFDIRAMKRSAGGHERASVQKSADVPVHQPDDADTERRRRRLGAASYTEHEHHERGNREIPHDVYYQVVARLFVAQEDIRRLKRELAGIEIRAVAQNDDRQLVAGEAVNHRPESHRAP